MNNIIKDICDIKLPPLAAGSHDSPEDGLCFMEMVSYMERLPHSDAPECVCPVIRKICMVINDAAPMFCFREKLKPYLSRVVGTANSSRISSDREKLVERFIKDSPFYSEVERASEFGPAMLGDRFCISLGCGFKYSENSFGFLFGSARPMMMPLAFDLLDELIEMGNPKPRSLTLNQVEALRELEVA